MISRQIATPLMLSRLSSDGALFHFTYNQTGFIYNEPLYTYEAKRSRGNIAPRTVLATQMRGR